MADAAPLLKPAPNPSYMGRYENKYLISDDVRVAFWPQVEARMRPDPHGALGPGTYKVHSIYLDSPDLKAYHEKLQGMLQRAKVRIRYYQLGKGPINLEIKERLNNQILKSSFRLDKSRLQRCLRGLPLLDDERIPAVKMFNRNVRWHNIRPVVLVSYTRKAFTSSQPGNLRVTLDYDITARNFCPQGFHDTAEYPVLHPQWTVLEIKFNGIMPRVVSEWAKTYNFAALSVSKYCHCVSRLMKLGRIPSFSAEDD